MKSCLKIENCAACHVHSQGLYYVTCEFTWNDLRKLIEHQRAPRVLFRPRSDRASYVFASNKF